MERTKPMLTRVTSATWAALAELGEGRVSSHVRYLIRGGAMVAAHGMRMKMAEIDKQLEGGNADDPKVRELIAVYVGLRNAAEAYDKVAATIEDDGVNDALSVDEMVEGVKATSN